MSESYRVGAYWGCRPESAEVCAGRAEAFFRLLAKAHPSYVRWFQKNNSPRKALQLGFEPTQETFLGFFEKKKHQSGNDGFHLGAWTGHVDQEQGGMVMLHCGSRAEVAPNHLLLFFPEEALGQERMLTAPVLEAVMRAMALAWEPDWAIATSDGLWELLSNGSRLGGFVGWMTYFARQRGALPVLPAPVCAESLDDKGTLVILTPDRLTASNPEHVALAQHVQHLLDAGGLLTPVVPPRFPPGA